MFLGCFMEVSGGVSRKIKGCSETVKGVSGEFQRSSNDSDQGVSKVLRKFQSSFNAVKRNF